MHSILYFLKFWVNILDYQILEISEAMAKYKQYKQSIWQQFILF